MSDRMRVSLSELITDSKLRQLAGSVYFGRGATYFRDGHVACLEVDGKRVKAKVRGNGGSYKTEIGAASNGRLVYKCSCPLGYDDEFCKHLVATGLAFINRDVDASDEPPSPPVDVKAFLGAMDKDGLVAFILNLANENSDLSTRLELLAAGSKDRKASSRDFTKAIDNAFYMDDGFVGYKEIYDYSAGIELVLDSLREAFKNGQHEAAMRAAEHALSYVDEVMNSSDSECELSDLFIGFLELFMEAAAKVKPPPEKLAAKLLKWKLNDGFAVFDRLDEFAGQLEPAVGKELGRLAKIEWAQLPPLKPGEERDYGVRSVLERMMLDALPESNALEKRIEIMSKDLGGEDRYLRIAELCRDAKRHDLAIKWAEDGVKAFKKGFCGRLQDFLVDEYIHEKRFSDATSLAWSLFAQSASLQCYQKLLGSAKEAGSVDEWREKALRHIRGKPNVDWRGKPDRSLLVEIFLWEKRDDDAWKEATEGGCDSMRWSALSRARGKEHPADSAFICKEKLLPALLARTGDNAYRDTIVMLEKLKDYMKRDGKLAEFKSYCDELRLTCKARRNFIRDMDKAKL